MNSDEFQRETKKLDGRKALGKRGEEIAVRYLKEKGFQILAQNWRCRTGEVDIILLEEPRCLIFTEVRSRRVTGKFGSAAESINRRKQQQIRQTALYYVYVHPPFSRYTIRFDVVTVEFFPEKEDPVIHHIKAAF
ncbi:YraN family protein [Paenibacillus larvae subsp. pulvifaciens]|uniref:UPF0102 protein B7C51_21730 n=1 Tax=Paenibacillus larvae subsp. pulvifaciens TaxID=1477 RepID=A0A1V0UY80_9BACL|nr:YraN family protein [Paenibacillus larvae]ARF69900.1 YraN family protein [Paenibacillus larvae subsp. pulvifaciens]